MYLILNRWFFIIFDHAIISNNKYPLFMIDSTYNRKWIVSKDLRLNFHANFYEMSQLFLIYYSLEESCLFLFNWNWSYKASRTGHTGWHERNFDVARCNVCDKGGANKRRIKSRIKPGRIFFPSNRTLLYGATPSNVILFVNPKGGHGWENELDYQ